MGGAALSLYTPRMQPHVYRHVRDKCHAALQQLFVCVATPVEGPAKDSFGDIDIFVCLNKSVVFPTKRLIAKNGVTRRDGKVDWSAVKSALEAVESKQQNPQTMNIAIPWPKDLPATEPEPDPTVDHADHANSDQTPYIQVDVRMCKSPDELQWFLFKHCHGDLWNILGSMIRPFGLTIDEVGLHLRITQVENENRKLAKVLLTTDPSMVLKFLGLKALGNWDAPFASEEAMFEYAATCRLFWIDPAKKDGPDGTGEDAGEDQENPSEQLKNNDRQRIKKRQVFRNWIEDFIPRCRAEGRYPNPYDGKSRSDMRTWVREAAFEIWGHAKLDYQQRYLKWKTEKLRIQIQNDFIKGTVPSDISCALPEPKEGGDAAGLERSYRGVLVSALKKIIMFDDGTFGIVPDPPLKAPDGLYDIEGIKTWVETHWQEVGEVAWQQMTEKSVLAMKAKELKRKAAAAALSSTPSP